MGTLTWTPPEIDEYTLTISATDARGVVTTITATITAVTISPTVSVVIDQATIDAEAVLGTDVTATATIDDAGAPPLTAGEISISWVVNGQSVANGATVDAADEVFAGAAWSTQYHSGSADSAAITVSSWSPYLWGLGDPREDANAMSADVFTDGAVIGAGGGASKVSIASPDAYMPDPARIVSGGQNWHALGLPFGGTIANGEVVDVAWVIRRGTSGLAVKGSISSDALGRETVFGRAANGVVSSTVMQQLGAWSALTFELVTGSDGLEYEIILGTFTANQAITDAQIRISPNSTTVGEYVDLYRVGGTAGQSAPANTALPAITATGLSLTGSLGTWTGTPAPTFARQWERSTNSGSSWADITGATDESFDASGEADGTQLRVEVTATNNQGSATATSAAYTVSLSSGTVADVFFEHDVPSPESGNKVQVAGPRRIVVDVADGIMQDFDLNPSTGNLTTQEGSTLNGWREQQVAWNGGWVATSSVGGKSYTVTRDGYYEVPDAANYAVQTRRKRWLLNLGADMADGETVTIHPSGRAGLAMSATYNDDAKGFAINVPHHGFATDSPDKRAIVGGWCGAEIPGLSTSTRWGVWDVNAGAFVSGWGYADTADLVQERWAGLATTELNGSENVTTSHRVLWADFSALTTPGRYKICVEGYGASYAFDIADEVTSSLLRHMTRGFRLLAHTDVLRNDMVGDNLHMPNPLLLATNKRRTGRTFASVRRDGIWPGTELKVWDGNGSNSFYVYPGPTNERILRELDPILDAIVIDDQLDGYRDAADYDMRPQHAYSIALLQMLTMSSATVRGLDAGFPERTGGNARAYDKTIMGGAITGTVALSDMDHLALHGVDGYTRLQVLSSAGDWSAGPGKFPANLGAWEGAVSSGYDFGDYLGWPQDFAGFLDPWPDASVNSGRYELNILRPDPWASYAYAGAAAVAALRFQQLGDTKMRTVYAERAKAAYDWAALWEGSTSGIMAPRPLGGGNTIQIWNPSWRSTKDFRKAKALACVGMWAITSGSERNAYHAAWKTVTNYSQTGGPENPTEAAALYLLTAHEPSIGVTGHVAGDLSALENDARNRIGQWHTRAADPARSLYGVPVGWDHGGFNFDNQVCTIRNAPMFLSGAFMMRSALTAAQREDLRQAFEAEVHFAAGRCPSGRTFITSMGHDFRRSIHYNDWKTGARGFTTPGIVGFGLVGNGTANGLADAGYRANGDTGAEHIPYAMREIVGRAGTSGEFQVSTTLVPSLFAAGAVAAFAGD